MNERKNLGPAINPTAVTNIAVPMFETIPNKDLTESLQRVIVFSPTVKDWTLEKSTPTSSAISARRPQRYAFDLDRADKIAERGDDKNKKQGGQ